jgi:TonB family protein
MIGPLSLRAVDARGLKVVIRDQAGQQVGLYKASYALVIGVSDYLDGPRGWPDLPGVRRDVIRVKAALEGRGFHVTMVTNPTRVQLEQAFNDFIGRYGLEPGHRLLFYFSGHGHTEKSTYGEEMGYIVPADAPNPKRDRNGFLTTAIDMQMMEVYAKRIQSKHALFLFDSCFSGSIFAISRAIPQDISYKTAKPVRQFITSGSAEETVPDKSLFCAQFVAALEGEADVSGDGYVTGTELGEFLESSVINYSKGAQHPQYGKIRNRLLDKGDFVFALEDGTGEAARAQAEAARAKREAKQAEAETDRLRKQLDQARAEQEAEEARRKEEQAKAEAVRLRLELERVKEKRIELPDDVAIETTQLDVWEENISPPPLVAVQAPPPEENEAVPFWHVEKPPELIHAVSPTYPEIARKAQMEGKVFLQLLVGKNGEVEDVKFIKGPEIFKEAAVKAARQFLFSPALQDDKPVRVWMAVPIEFMEKPSRREDDALRVKEKRIELLSPSVSPAETITVTLPGGATMEMVWIEPGTFTMGSPSSESGRGDDEGPQHEVTISRGFYLGKYEITQKQWKSVMGTRPWSETSYAQENRSNAASHISWNDVQTFIWKLNRVEGSEVYRLPTEAEWEYSCRAGTTTQWSFGDDESQLGEYAWYRDNAWNVGEKYAHAVGRKLPNPWGLHDMHGNVWEWCHDWYGSYSSISQTDPSGVDAGSYRVFRGGYFYYDARSVRSAFRRYDSPGRRYNIIGARLARQGN